MNRQFWLGAVSSLVLNLFFLGGVRGIVNNFICVYYVYGVYLYRTFKTNKMRITFILKDLTTHFYTELEKMSAQKAYEYLTSVHNMKFKVNGTDSFMDLVEFKQKIKKTDLKTKLIEKRRGYNLLTLTF